MLYYDPFDTQEEEEFWERQQLESKQQVQRYIQRLQAIEEDYDDQQHEHLFQVQIQQCCNRARQPCTDAQPASVEEIRLEIPLERSSLESLVQELLTNPKATCQLRKLSFSHWGLESEGIPLVLPLLTPTVACKAAGLTHLSLTNAGLQVTAVQELMQTLTNTGSFIQELDISRNNLMTKSLAWDEYLPKCPSLKTLRLSSTGLTTDSLWRLWKACSSNTTTSSKSLHILDISYNFDDVQVPLQSLSQYLAVLRTSRNEDSSSMVVFQLQSLLLAKGASSSTCLDYDNSNSQLSCTTLELLRGLCQGISSPHCRLQRLGPSLSILPLDRQSTPQLHQAYAQCHGQLALLQHYYLPKNQWDQQYLQPLLFGRPDTDSTNHANSTIQRTTAPLLFLPPLSSLAVTLATIAPRSASESDGCKCSLVYHIVRETSSQWARI